MEIKGDMIMMNKLKFPLLLLFVLAFNRSFAQPPAPSNDACSNATNLPCGTSALSGTTNNTAVETHGTGCTMSGYGVWYTFAGDGLSTTISSTAAFDHEMAIASGSCGSLTNISCNDVALSGGTETYTFTSVVGTTYYVYIAHYSSSSTTTGTFTISRTCTAAPTAPANDDPCSATVLTAGTSCSFTSSTNANATASSGVPAPGCSSYLGGDVWFQVTVPASGHLIFDSNTGVVLDGGMAIYSGTCGSLTLIECDDDDSGNGAMPYINNSSLTPGSTVWIRFWEYGNNNNGTFSICVYDGLINTPGATCSNAINITSLPYTQTGQSTCSMGDDYDSGDACGSSYMNGDDFVYSYTPSTNQSIDVTLSNTGTYTGVFVTQGCPSTGTCVDYDEQSGGNPSVQCVALTAGVTYYIVISTYPSPQCGAFDISVTQSTSSAPTCNLNYALSTPGYSTTGGGGWTSLSFSDDRFADSYTDLGFSFCYDNVFYTQCLVSSNGYIIFPGCYTDVPGGDPIPSGYSPYTVDAAIPNNYDAPMNAILLTWQDIDPSVNGTIRYKTIGTAPNRTFVLQYVNVAMFGSSCNTISSIYFSGELRLYETSNIIDFAIGNKGVCTSWISGAGIMGLHNYTGTIAVVPAGHNYPTQWSESNTSYRFTPGCACSNPLAIEMIDLSVEGKENYNELKWSTSFNDQISEFTIERSTNARNFTELEKVSPRQSSYSEYTYRDENPELTNYYRVKITDFFGNTQYSRTVIASKNRDLEITNIWPVPVEENLNITMYAPMDLALNVELIDVTGRVLSTENKMVLEGDNTITISTSNLSSGVYHLVIKDSKGTIRVGESIIKE